MADESTDKPINIDGVSVPVAVSTSAQPQMRTNGAGPTIAQKGPQSAGDDNKRSEEVTPQPLTIAKSSNRGKGMLVSLIVLLLLSLGLVAWTFFLKDRDAVGTSNQRTSTAETTSSGQAQQAPSPKEAATKLKSADVTAAVVEVDAAIKNLDTDITTTTDQLSDSSLNLQ